MNEDSTPVKIPVISEADANIPAVVAYCDSTVLKKHQLNLRK